VLTVLKPGFSDPVMDGQAVFRKTMDALAQPGTLQELLFTLDPPAPLTPELAAIALTLADHEAPLWLDAALRGSQDVVDYLRFHTGAAIVSDPQDAAFALICDPAAMPKLDAFSLGIQEYPDRSTTIVIALETLETGRGFALSGPGISETSHLVASPLPADFLAQWQANRSLFPCGVDLILTAPGRIAGLPRSTVITEEG
jgi:alpha-D-ribose 1-methylphosphonate 5-triphosphate synthase subunit PhnH